MQIGLAWPRIALTSQRVDLENTKLAGPCVVHNGGGHGFTSAAAALTAEVDEARRANQEVLRRAGHQHLGGGSFRPECLGRDEGDVRKLGKGGQRIGKAERMNVTAS